MYPDDEGKINMKLAFIRKAILRRRDEMNAVNSFDKNHRNFKHIYDIYENSWGKRRKYIAEVLDRYFNSRFNLCLDSLKKGEHFNDSLDELNYTLFQYRRYRPEETENIIVRRNNILLGGLQAMIDKGNDLTSVMNYIADIEQSYQDAFRVMYDTAYSEFATRLYAKAIPVAESIAGEISAGGRLTFRIALPENIIGLVQETDATFDDKGMSFDAKHFFIPYSHIPDFDDGDFEEKLPLVSDTGLFTYIMPTTVGAHLLKHILTIQRKRVSPDGKLPENVADAIKKGFEEIRHERFLKESRRHEEEMDWLRECYMLQCDP